MSVIFIANISYFCMDKDFFLGGGASVTNVRHAANRKMGHYVRGLQQSCKRRGCALRGTALVTTRGGDREVCCSGGSQAQPARPSGKERLVIT